MFRTLSQIENVLLVKAEAQLKKDLKPHIEQIKKTLCLYGVSDVEDATASVYKLLYKHIKTPLAQESILKHKADDLVMKLEDLEDLVYDTCGDVVSDYNRYP